MQVEVFGADQRVRDRLLGQVTPLEIVGNHNQGFFSGALKFNVARRYARAFARGARLRPSSIRFSKSTMGSSKPRARMSSVRFCNSSSSADGISWQMG
jgi:hypothetical protein